MGLAVRSESAVPAAGEARSWGARLVIAAAIWLVLVGNAAIIIGLWLSDGGVSAIHHWADLVTSIGRITGLLGAYLLLLQVLLISRLPFLERFIGFDRITVWHRRNGKLCLYLVLAHVVFITVGYAATDRLSIPSEASILLQQYPGMVTATFGTALMIIAVLTSLIIVRRRLRYEMWYLVHLTAYAGIILGWPHQLPTGNDFVALPAHSGYWTSLYLATLALVVLFRFVRPILRGFWLRLRVVDVRSEGPGVTSVRIAGRRLDRLQAKPGQFFLWRFLSRDRWWEAHPFSLSQAPDGRILRLTAKSLGDFTAHLTDLKPGTTVVVEGPFGRFTRDVVTREKLLLIAGGIGITPIRALAEDLPGDLVLIHRVVRDEDIIFRRELERIAADRGIGLHYIVGDHRAPGAGYLLSPAHLRELVPDIAEREVFLCGPPAMMDVLEKNVRAAGVSRRLIHTERFALAL